MSIRKLKVIQIEDNPENHLEPSLYEDHVDLLRPAAEVEALSKQILEHNHGMPDIILADVDMGMVLDPTVKEFEWGAAKKVPYGPMLALPFLRGARVRAFEAYSSLWGTDEIVNNGFVALSVAMLLAAGRGEPVGLNEAREHIANTEHLPSEPNRALKRALAQYRRLLQSRAGRDGDIEIVDVRDVVDRLYLIEDKAGKKPLQLPFEDDEGTLSVIIEQEGKTDEIELTSLFADILDFDTIIEPKRLEKIHQELSAWEEVSIVKQGEDLYDHACNILDECSKIGVTLKEAVEKNERHFGRINRFRVIRTCMLFAWVTAWHTQPTSNRKINQVHEILGYLDIDPEGKTKAKMKTSVGNDYKRLLTIDGSAVWDGPDRARLPFTSTPKKVKVKGKYIDSVNDAYQLERNEQYELSYTDRKLCRQYALRKFEWMPEFDKQKNKGEPKKSDPPYPKWME